MMSPTPKPVALRPHILTENGTAPRPNPVTVNRLQYTLTLGRIYNPQTTKQGFYNPLPKPLSYMLLHHSNKISPRQPPAAEQSAAATGLQWVPPAPLQVRYDTS